MPPIQDIWWNQFNPLELYHRSLEQDQQKFDKNRHSRSWRNSQTTFILQHLFPHRMGLSLGTTLVAYLYLPKPNTLESGISKTRLLKHGKHWKTHVFKKTNQRCLTLRRYLGQHSMGPRSLWIWYKPIELGEHMPQCRSHQMGVHGHWDSWRRHCCTRILMHTP
jgi:hypothetical protein